MWHTCFSRLLTATQRKRTAAAAAAAVLMTLIMIKKGKFISSHTMKAYNRNRGTAPLILDLGIRWR